MLRFYTNAHRYAKHSNSESDRQPIHFDYVPTVIEGHLDGDSPTTSTRQAYTALVCRRQLAEVANGNIAEAHTADPCQHPNNITQKEKHLLSIPTAHIRNLRAQIARNIPLVVIPSPGRSETAAHGAKDPVRRGKDIISAQESGGDACASGAGGALGL